MRSRGSMETRKAWMALAVLAFLDRRRPSGEPRRHTFTSGDHIITMDVRFADPYVGKRLVFYNGADSRKEICLAGNGEAGACPNRFVGAVATVTFTVKRAGGKLRRKT